MAAVHLESGASGGEGEEERVSPYLSGRPDSGHGTAGRSSDTSPDSRWGDSPSRGRGERERRRHKLRTRRVRPRGWRRAGIAHEVRAFKTRPGASRSPLGAAAVELSGPPRPRTPRAARRKTSSTPRCANATASWSPPAADAAARRQRWGGDARNLRSARASASGAALTTEVSIETARASCGVAKRHGEAPRAPRPDQRLFSARAKERGGVKARSNTARGGRNEEECEKGWLGRPPSASGPRRPQRREQNQRRRAPSRLVLAQYRAQCSALRLLCVEARDAHEHDGDNGPAAEDARAGVRPERDTKRPDQRQRRRQRRLALRQAPST
ncbi:hypothetical protein HPB50_018032 [Hyalomma asiaticum]|uniref:Uncharacterized protein n=1 Tax=Hyalomma asiaticum TaxID=266040 RepID=A0ACB7S6D8_HYAAI|nr:hypothetical protein HPB50_018032 [Hyalomma asiaticum]